MKTELIIEGRGLEELYQYLEQCEVEADVKYKFNHWFLYADIAAITVKGDMGELFDFLFVYYENRKQRNVEVMVNGKEKVVFTNRKMEEIRREVEELQVLPC